MIRGYTLIAHIVCARVSFSIVAWQIKPHTIRCRCRADTKYDGRVYRTTQTMATTNEDIILSITVWTFYRMSYDLFKSMSNLLWLHTKIIFAVSWSVLGWFPKKKRRQAEWRIGTYCFLKYWPQNQTNRLGHVVLRTILYIHQFKIRIYPTTVLYRKMLPSIHIQTKLFTFAVFKGSPITIHILDISKSSNHLLWCKRSLIR